MQGIRPSSLSNNELLRYIYIMGFDNVPGEWLKVLVERFTQLLDTAALPDDNK